MVIFLWWSIFKFKLVLGGAPDAGWTSYASLALASKGHGVDFYVLGLQISGIGTLIGGINFLVTIINMRAPGMTYMRMPMFTWTTFVTSSLILFAFPPLTVGLGLLMLDRLFGTSFFNPALGGIQLYGSIYSGFSVIQKYIFLYSQLSEYSQKSSQHFRKTIVWLFIDGVCDCINWIFRIYGMGAPYVYC